MQIHTLDLCFGDLSQAVAAHLVVGPDGPALVETGPSSTLPALREELAALGYRPADIKHVFLTHIHLDHAGAAGWWAGQGAQIYVHHAGAPHLLDPSRLLASAGRLYGDRMEALWGEMLPVPEGQLTSLGDCDVVEAAGLRFTALDTPGHARHHLVYRVGDVAFSGDAAAMRLPCCRYISLPTPPPEFDLEAWRQTVARLAAENFSALYPVHFGRIDAVAEHLATLDELLVQSAEFVRSRMEAGQGRDEIVEQYTVWNEERAVALDVPEDMYHRLISTNGMAMSVDGLMRYWRKRWER